MGRGSVFVIAALLLSLSALAASQRGEDARDEAAVAGFEEAVTSYTALRAAAIEGLAAPESSRGMEKIRAGVEARHDAVAAARQGARQGDLISKPVARAFRDRIHDSLALHGLNPVQALAIIDDEVSGPVPMLVVNGHFPWDYGSGMLPCVLDVLPPLPRGLQYRFVHTTLVLLDVEANLIVDMLPDALPAAIYA